MDPFQHEGYYIVSSCISCISCILHYMVHLRFPIVKLCLDIYIYEPLYEPARGQVGVVCCINLPVRYWVCLRTKCFWASPSPPCWSTCGAVGTLSSRSNSWASCPSTPACSPGGSWDFLCCSATPSSLTF